MSTRVGTGWHHRPGLGAGHRRDAARGGVPPGRDGVEEALCESRGVGVARVSAGMPDRLSMKWQAPLAILLGSLLVAPLAGLLYVSYRGGVRQASAPGTIPMLSPGERQGLLTYGRHCQRSSECEPPLACLFNTRFMASYCTDSRCRTDQDCSEGFACRVMPARDGVSRVHICALVGVRKEGDPCLASSDSREDGCGPGLFCQGRCGRSCRLDEPGSCSEGFFCSDALEGPSCLPTCEGRSCPEGRQCIRSGRQASVCVEVHGQNCQRTACPDGQRCDVTEPSARPDEVWMECVTFCGQGKPACPEGLICEQLTCQKPCDPNAPDACGPHRKCRRDMEKGPWTCGPDV